MRRSGVMLRERVAAHYARYAVVFGEQEAVGHLIGWNASCYPAKLSQHLLPFPTLYVTGLQLDVQVGLFRCVSWSSMNVSTSLMLHGYLRSLLTCLISQ